MVKGRLSNNVDTDLFPLIFKRLIQCYIFVPNSIYLFLLFYYLRAADQLLKTFSKLLYTTHINTCLVLLGLVAIHITYKQVKHISNLVQ